MRGSAHGIFSKRQAKPKPSVSADGPTYSEPNQSELDWMLGHLEFASEMHVNIDDLEQISSFYDVLLQSWTESPPASPSDPNGSINIIGTVFGEHLVRRTTMRWVIATDEYGTELAIHDTDTDLLVYPANAVAKRWSAQESGAFIPGFGDDILRRVRPNS